MRKQLGIVIAKERQNNGARVLLNLPHTSGRRTAVPSVISVAPLKENYEGI
ncbi:MAG: hypothetical protein KAW47_00950 [Thermoplasmatales archaeon]|nr:hypothetical protein [Thermoplasmatales archaeon]